MCEGEFWAKHTGRQVVHRIRKPTKVQYSNYAEAIQSNFMTCLLWMLTRVTFNQMPVNSEKGNDLYGANQGRER